MKGSLILLELFLVVVAFGWEEPMNTRRAIGNGHTQTPILMINIQIHVGMLDIQVTMTNLIVCILHHFLHGGSHQQIGMMEIVPPTTTTFVKNRGTHRSMEIGPKILRETRTKYHVPLKTLIKLLAAYIDNSVCSLIITTTSIFI